MIHMGDEFSRLESWDKPKVRQAIVKTDSDPQIESSDVREMQAQLQSEHQ
jgi:hypothetical protein